jgi:hypothetical protein
MTATIEDVEDEDGPPRRGGGNVRLPPALLDQVRRLGRRERRGVGAQVQTLIEEALRARGEELAELDTEPAPARPRKRMGRPMKPLIPRGSAVELEQQPF